MQLALKIFKLWLVFSIAIIVLALIGVNRFYISSDQQQTDLATVYHAIEQQLPQLSWNNKLQQTQSLKSLLKNTDLQALVLHQDGNVIEFAQSAELTELPLVVKEFKITNAGEQNITLVAMVNKHEHVSNIIIWFVIIFVMSQPLFYWLIRKLLKPWEAEVAQQNATARAICHALDREPGGQPPVTVAFNGILDKLQELSDTRVEQADRRRGHSFIDKLTGLGNRAFFDARLEVFLHETDAVTHGGVIIVHFGALQWLLDEGRENEFENLMVEAANILRVLFQDPVNEVIARRSEFDFAILLHQVTPKQAAGRAGKLLKNLRKLNLPSDLDNTNYVHMGIACYQQDKNAYDVLAEADMALRTAQLEGPNGYYMYEQGELDMSRIRGSVRWRAFLESLIENRDVIFHFQPIVEARSSQTTHFEALVRINDGGEIIRAATFMPMVAKCGFTMRLDRMILDLLFQRFIYNEGLPEQKLCFNVSVESLLNEQFMSWLAQRLGSQPNFAQHVMFELPEYAVTQNIEGCQQAIQQLKDLGCAICIDHVGQHLGSSDYLQRLKVDSIKLHNSVVRNIHGVAENQQFVEGLIDFAESLHVRVCAEGVENQKEWEWLLDAGIDAGQGYYFAEPKEVSDL